MNHTDYNIASNFHSELNFCGFDNTRLRRSAEMGSSLTPNRNSVPTIPKLSPRQTAQIDDRIIGGETVANTISMPWVVRLEFKKYDGSVNQCAGTVVHKNYVLTTNSCCQVSQY